MLYLFYILFARFIISNLNWINKPTVHAHIHVQPSKQDIIVLNAPCLLANQNSRRDILRTLITTTLIAFYTTAFSADLIVIGGVRMRFYS